MTRKTKGRDPMTGEVLGIPVLEFRIEWTRTGLWHTWSGSDSDRPWYSVNRAQIEIDKLRLAHADRRWRIIGVLLIQQYPSETGA